MPRAKNPNNVKANKSPKRLSKPKKVIAAKVMDDDGYSNAEIATWLGISEATASRYRRLDTPEKFKAFESEFKKTLAIMKYDGLGKVHKRINELVPNERRISEVVKAGEFLEGKHDRGTQVNIAGTEMNIEFIATDE